MSFSSILGAPGAEGQFKYSKKKLIGTGSYGEAWLVQRNADGAIFVAKVMDLSKMSSRDRGYAYSEIKCLASCNHPNIIQYIEDQEDGENLLIVMEFADSGDLDRQIKNRAQEGFKYFQEHEALFLFLQLCLALDHIHAHKMLHRDIKGANILLTSTGLIKLGDFGFSHQYDDTVSGVVANTFCGTPYYLAPELWNNQRYSKKADVWSLGVLLYEIMSLTRPFTATNMKGLMAKVLSGDYEPLPDRFSSDFRNVVRQILVCDANERPSIRDIFRFPYVREGLKVFIHTVKKNARISDTVKEALLAHATEILSNETVEEVRANPVGQINKEVTFKGYVKKMRGGDSNQSWKKKYLQVQKGHLILSDTESDTEGKALSLEQVQSVCPVPMTTAKREFVFALNTIGGKSMWFEARTQQDMEEWIHAIQRGLGIA
ncbi:protein kinase [Angomonas deanei]|uniref:non-specific serine/threonine protein kinase n=1 Tax=Angomonas deanei TaxID=59799 RepID=S9VIT8_9TRYP|nr:protein kinase [Angomonas deanei]EPY41926.1 protein kinase [Angomonas deanei]EPY42354.1 protein kinase [Angomonas deanei]CAD2213464.1 Protein kinase domain/Protein tyrosine kinase/Kinase-like/PH domain containing protein, putative [Angomonas deanei]|eukprot:EPY27036.1 protein kinase [Angomonas deanei]